MTPAGRALLVQRVLNEGWNMAAATQAMGVSCRTGFSGLVVSRA
ncbi:leucine zipper domain-containing protein [Hydrogenophaga sp. ZJX-1]